jgi:hypothetical protein
MSKRTHPLVIVARLDERANEWEAKGNQRRADACRVEARIAATDWLNWQFSLHPSAFADGDKPFATDARAQDWIALLRAEDAAADPDTAMVPGDAGWDAWWATPPWEGEIE